MEVVSGEKKGHHVKIYTISTCGWCRKTKELLKSLDIQYEYVDIDQVKGEERDAVLEELSKHNPRKTAPTIVIDDGEKVIIGYHEHDIKELAD
jgi:glutaredoxin